MTMNSARNILQHVTTNTYLYWWWYYPVTTGSGPGVRKIPS